MLNGRTNPVEGLKDTIKTIGPVKRALARKALNLVSLRYLLPETQVRLVEEDPEKKSEVVDRQAGAWKEKTAQLNAAIDHIFAARPEFVCGGAEALRLDMLFCFFAYGFSPNEYLCYGLKDKSALQRREFVSDRDSVFYGYRMNDFMARRVFMDKMRTYERFRPFFKREAICIQSKSDYQQYLRFVQTHPVFVKKDVMETCGRSIELIDLASDDATIETFFHSLMNGRKYILEERVLQSEKMAAFNRSSVNTVRCLTVNTRHGILTPWCFLKVGREGSFVDNGGAGGILVGIDVESGKLATAGIDELALRYEAHPDTGIEFVGYQLPDWEDMLSMCREMAAMEPKNKWIGWDLAHTDQGWVVIEGNALSEVIGPQSTWQKSIRRELDSYLNDMDLFM